MRLPVVRKVVGQQRQEAKKHVRRGQHKGEPETVDAQGIPAAGRRGLEVGGGRAGRQGAAGGGRPAPALHAARRSRCALALLSELLRAAMGYCRGSHRLHGSHMHAGCVPPLRAAGARPPVAQVERGVQRNVHNLQSSQALVSALSCLQAGRQAGRHREMQHSQW